jgi:hypothetical protein
MKRTFAASFLPLVITVAFVGCSANEPPMADAANMSGDSMMKRDKMMNNDGMMKDGMMKEDKMMKEGAN